MAWVGLATASHAQTYGDNLWVRALPESTAESLLLEFYNLNEPGGPQRKRFVDRIVVAGSAEHPAIRLLSYTVTVLDAAGEKPEAEYTREEFEDQFGEIPAARVLAYYPMGFFRNDYLGTLKITPGLDIRLGGDLVRLEFQEFRAELAFPDAVALKDSASSDPLKRNVLGPLAVNGSYVFAHSVSPGDETRSAIDAARAWAAWLQEAAQAGAVAEIEVQNAGPVVIGAGDFAAARMDFDPAAMRLYCDGREVPLALLHPGENWQAVFVAAPFDERTIHARKYYLAASPPDAAEAPKRRAIEDGVNAEAFATAGRGLLGLEPRLDYFHKIEIADGFSHWYWMEIPRNEFRTITASLPDLNPEGQAAVVRLFLPVIDDAQNLCRLYVNGAPVGNFRYQGGKHGVFEQEVPIELWKAGINDLVLEFPIQDLNNPAENLYLSRCEIEYPQVLQAQDGYLASRVEAKGPVSLSFGGFAEPPVVADITDPAAPRFYAAAPDGGTKFSATVDGSGPREIVAFASDAARGAHSIEAVGAQDFLGDSLADIEHLVLAPRAFLDALQPLLEHRRANGTPVEAVAVEDVFRQFGYGARRPVAIRTFLRSVFFAHEEPRLCSVLLIGESSDLEGAQGDCPADASEDQLPVFWESQPAPEPRGDFPYAYLTPDDALPDISLARIPASSPEQLAQVIGKIIHYETKMTTGLWRSRNLFITDDEPVFSAVADEVKVDALPGQYQTVNVRQADYPYVHFYEGIDRKWSPEAAQAFLDRFNEGALTTLFLGHGGPNIWTHERMFHLDEMRRLHNADSPTLLAIGSCDSAWLDYPLEPGKVSLGERFILHPDGGAIGVFAPVSGATPFDHQMLLAPFFRALFREDIPRTGDAVLYATLRYLGTTGHGELDKQYVLLGDPLTAVSPPPGDLAVFASPAQHLAKTQSIVTITANWPGADSGEAIIALRISGKDNRILASGVPIRGGRMRHAWRTPGDLPEGDHTISVYGQDDQGRGEALGSTTITVLREAYQLMVNPDLLQIRTREAGEVVDVDFTIENRCLTDAPDVTLRLQPVGTSQRPVEQKFELGARERVSRSMQVSLTEGLKVLDLTVYGSSGSPEAAKAWERARLVFPAMRKDAPGGSVETLGELLEIQPADLPPNAPLTFRLPLWNLSSQPTAPLAVLLQDETGRPLGTEVTLGDPLAPGAHSWVEFKDTEGLPPGQRRITAVIRPAGEEDAQPLLSVSRTVQIEPQADLEFVPGSVRFESKEFIDGQTIFIHATVRNVGGRESQPASVEAYKGREREVRQRISSAFRAYSAEVPPLEPGTSHDVALRWDDLHLAGEQLVRLWVNPGEKIPENDYANNSIEGIVAIQPLGNIFIADGSLKATPPVARPGQTVRLEARIRSDRKQDLSELRVAVFGGGGLSPLALIGDPLQPEPGARGEFPVSFDVAAGKDRHVFALEANYKRLVAETMPDDNRAEASVDLLLSLEDFPRSSPVHDLLAEADAARLFGARINPRGELACADFADYEGTVYPMGAALLRGDMTTRESSESMADGRWLLTAQGIEAAPGESVEPMQIEVPYPEMPARAYNVFLTVNTDADYRGVAPASMVGVQLPGQESMTPYDFTNDVLPWHAIRYSVGRSGRQGELFTMQVGHEEGQAWTVVHRVELVPLTGRYESPLIDLGAHEGHSRVRLHSAFSAPEGSAVQYEMAFGELDAAGQPQWQAWQAIAPGGDLPIEGGLMRLRAYLMASRDGMPVVQTLGFELLP